MKKYWPIKFGIFLSYLLLLAVLLRINLIRGGFFREQARNNKIQTDVIVANRGKIIDRKGRVVAETVWENGVQRRKYYFGESMGVVTGYIGKMDEKEMKGGVCGRKQNGETLVGRGGIEEEMDCQLLGIDGKKLSEVDALGEVVRELGVMEAVSGKDVQTSIDAYWQEKMYKLMEGKKGAAIVSEVGTGKILVLVSSPSFDANAFAYIQDKQMISDYINDLENRPLLNRAIGAKYHPGSVFKLTMATAGLEEGVINAETTIEDTGVIKVGEYSYNNWLWTKRGQTDGFVNVVLGLKRSNDIFFYRLGEKLGSEKIKKWATIFGLGTKTGIELPAEVAGLVPDAKWKKEVKKESWFLGNTYHLSIGQGDLETTPIQINLETSIIASDGKKCQMSILENKEPECKDLGIKTQNLELVTAGMRAACQTGGTAWPLFNFKTQIACKTGTAEVGDGSKDSHAWLTAFAPVVNPQIVITVLLERGGEGSDAAAPIVGDFLKEWFEEKETIVPRYQEVNENKTND